MDLNSHCSFKLIYVNLKNNLFLEKELKIKILLTIIVILLFSSCLSTSSKYPEDQMIIDTQITNLTEQIVETLSQGKKSTLAILDFVFLDGTSTMLGKYLQEELTIKIFRSKKVNVVERSMIQKVMEELKFSASGFVSEETAAKIGQLLGVEAIAVGSITDLGEKLKINSKIIEVNTGSLISVASVTFEKDNTTNSLLSQDLVLKTDNSHTEISNVSTFSEELESEPGNITFLLDQEVYITFEKAIYKSSESKVFLEGTIISKNSDVSLESSALYLKFTDNLGNVYRGYNMSIGNNSFYRKTDIIQGIDIPFRIEFRKIAIIPNSILRLEFFDQYNSWRINSGTRIEKRIRTNIPVIEG